MLKVRVIPCLDVAAGRVVKGVNFVDLRDAGDPVEQATVYDKAGADELCFLDIGASAENRDIMLDVVARTAERCFMPLTVGGGVRSLEDIRRLLLAGADKVSINTAAVAEPELVRRAAEKFGYDLPLTRAIADAVSVPVIASGGVGTLAHLVEGVAEGHANALLAASIFHFGEHSIAEAKATLAAAGIAVRT